MTESFEIGLGNNDTETRARAQEDFVVVLGMFAVPGVPTDLVPAVGRGA